MPSLQDQLLKAGLADEKKAKDVRAEKRQKRKQQPKGAQPTNEARERARQAREEQAARDRKLNQEREEAARQKAIQAQIRQLVETNRVNCRSGESTYQFVDGGKIKRIPVHEPMIDQLARGRLAVICLAGGEYEVVPEAVARKIMERDEKAVMVLHDRASDDTEDEDDPYADFKIPDDLMW